MALASENNLALGKEMYDAWNLEKTMMFVNKQEEKYPKYVIQWRVATTQANLDIGDNGEDYYKKAKTQDEVLGGESQPLVLLNSSLLDPTQVNMMIESKIYSSLQQKDDDRGNINNNRNAKMNKNRLF